MKKETIPHATDVYPIEVNTQKEDPQVRRPAEIIKEFCLNTSTHGLPGIARSESVHNRVFWTVSTLAFTGVMILFVTQAILQYFQYPTQTSVSIVFEWPQLFPAVTICNYSPLRYDRFIGPFLNYTNSLNLTNTNDTTNFTYQYSLYVRDFLTYKFNRKESFNDIFFSLDEMMIDCSFNLMPCSVANFTWFISSVYGFCYTFNAKLKNVSTDVLKRNSDYGGIGVFQVSLYAHGHQYVPYFTKAVGMTVVVHDNAQLPQIETTALYLAPGKHHKLGYTKKSSTFLASPYSDCRTEIDPGLQLILDTYKEADYGYARYQCYVSCLQAYTYEKCGCGNPFYWTAHYVILFGTNNVVNISLCHVQDPCYGAATTEFINTVSIFTTRCPNCSAECSNVDFIIRSSSLLTPPKYLLPSIKQFVESSNVSLSTNWSTLWESEIPSNYISLEVAYESIRSEVYSEQETIGPVDLLSNVGGQTGLWIGISFLSLMELAEMLYRLVRYQCYAIRDRIRGRNQVQDIRI